jgi:predicted nucleic acid-binding protein
MSGYLIDTNVISELTKPKPNKGVLAFLAEQEAPFISIITVHELVYGIERLEDGTKRQAALRSTIDEFLSTFPERILPANEPVARAAGLLRAKANKQGHTAHLADALIAATALVHWLTVATRNVGDFKVLGVPASNPWL